MSPMFWCDLPELIFELRLSIWLRASPVWSACTLLYLTFVLCRDVKYSLWSHNLIVDNFKKKIHDLNNHQTCSVFVATRPTIRSRGRVYSLGGPASCRSVSSQQITCSLFAFTYDWKQLNSVVLKCESHSFALSDSVIPIHHEWSC